MTGPLLCDKSSVKYAAVLVSGSAQARPSRANSLQLVTLITSTSIPCATKSLAALSTSNKIAPDPISVTCCFELPFSDVKLAKR